MVNNYTFLAVFIDTNTPFFYLIIFKKFIKYLN
jgi:hypothetical protein